MKRPNLRTHLIERHNFPPSADEPDGVLRHHTLRLMHADFHWPWRPWLRAVAILADIWKDRREDHAWRGIQRHVERTGRLPDELLSHDEEA